MIPHVAKIDFAQFYSPAFSDSEEARRFVECVATIPSSASKARIVLHQAARMLWIADRIQDVAKSRPAFQILFYLIAAEAVSKIVFSYAGEGKSRYHVRLFFEDICGPRQRDVLERAFARSPAGPKLSLREAVDLLYDIRCDVVHEGMYYTFTLRERPEDVPMLTPIGEGSVVALVTIEQLRQAVLEGAVLGTRRLLPPESPCSEIGV